MLAVVDGRAEEPAADRQTASTRGRFLRAALLGSLAAIAIDLWMLAGPGLTMVRDGGMLGSFFDVQGRALLDGRLDVDPAEVGLEGFRVDGRTYTYFGLVPAVLRLPVLAVTDDLDGRLTQISMLLALAVLLLAGAQLHWRVRRQVRPNEPPDRADLTAAFLLQVALGAGAVPLYLVSRPVVYHEAELWGAALSIAALAAVVGIVANPSSRNIAWAGALATLAVNARFSVGLGPILALGVLATGFAARVRSSPGGSRAVRVLASFGPRWSDRGAGRTLALLVAAAVVPLALYAAINAAKFERPFGLPIEKQVASQVEPSRKAALAANDGTIFGLKFVPTTLVQAARPDALGWTRAFPFVGLPSEPAPSIGDVRFDTIQPSLSAPTSMPALFLLALAGLFELLRRPRLRPLLGVLAGTAGGFAVTLTIAFVTTRYLADFLPFLLLGAVIGVHSLLRRGGRARWVLAGIAVLVLIGVVVNGSVGLLGQRLLYPEVTPAHRAAFVRTQDDVDRLLGRRPSGVYAGTVLPVPASGSPGDLFVVDRCAGLYVHGLDGEWLPVERTPRSGLHRLRVRFPSPRSHRPEAVLVLGSGPRRAVVTSRSTGAGIVLGVRVGARTAAASGPIALPSSRTALVQVSVDPLPRGSIVVVSVDGERAVAAETPPVSGRRRVGADPGGTPPFSGRLEPLDTPATACRTVASRSGVAGARRLAP
jgi:hypothetical protein